MTQKSSGFKLLIIGAALLFGRQAFAQNGADLPRVAAGFFGGITFPADQQFRQIYGSSQFVPGAQVDFRLWRRVLVFSGYEYRSRTGTAIGISDPLEFRMHTWKIGGLYAVPVRRWLLTAGGGIGLTFYREWWAAAGVDTSGKEPGLLLQAGAERRIARRISLRGRIEYSRIQARSSDTDVNLGGMGIAAGLTFRLK